MAGSVTFTSVKLRENDWLIQFTGLALMTTNQIPSSFFHCQIKFQYHLQTDQSKPSSMKSRDIRLLTPPPGSVGVLQRNGKIPFLFNGRVCGIVLSVTCVGFLF